MTGYKLARYVAAWLLLAVVAVLVLGDHGPAWLLGTLDDEDGDDD